MTGKKKKDFQLKIPNAKLILEKDFAVASKIGLLEKVVIVEIMTPPTKEDKKLQSFFFIKCQFKKLDDYINVENTIKQVQIKEVFEKNKIKDKLPTWLKTSYELAGSKTKYWYVCTQRVRYSPRVYSNLHKLYQNVKAVAQTSPHSVEILVVIDNKEAKNPSLINRV